MARGLGNTMDRNRVNVRLRVTRPRRIRNTASSRRTVVVTALVTILTFVSLLGPLAGQDFRTAEANHVGMKLPFAAGSTWTVLQGYNTSPREGGSHWNCDPTTLKDAISQSEACNAGWQYKYSLDLV